MGKLKTPVIIILAILLIDQALKFWVKTNMMLGDEFSVFGDWFYIHFVENNGMAFGMELGGDFGKIFLSVFRIVAVVGIGWYLYKLTLKKAPLGLIVSVSMVLAGALGNIIDSAFYGMIFNHSYSQIAAMFPEGGGYAAFLHGRVVDMFYFPIFSGTYPEWFPWVGGQDYIFFRPVFNIADSSITLGIIAILVFQKKFFEHEKEQ
ncbi:lipoprotein signal peptidase [Marinilabilia sp.]|uniref:lipoprotein signal peptidase n=1 Tax=Marinilabilia sp. TaxID=2021252 RepID=UPI0025C36D2A|nr:lipoprotein signal peptidase [Marinilabilia sp.]